jgi:phosphomannomutase
MPGMRWSLPKKPSVASGVSRAPDPARNRCDDGVMTKLRDAFPSVGFGTSGVRALVTDLGPEVVSSYARAFARHLLAVDVPKGACLLGWDLRPSSPAIAAAVAAGLEAEGLRVVVAGPVPTPALALAALARGLPAVMVTGSHIPFDRNGVKFYLSDGEVLKRDELAIGGIEADEVRMAAPGLAVAVARWRADLRPDAFDRDVERAYMMRYRALVSPHALRGRRVGVYQHSAVGRDLLVALLARLGADVIPLGRSDAFVPVDTEAVSPDDEAMAARWCAEHDLHAVVSTDGDGDRPWLCDERGRFIAGDLLGPLTARWLGVRRLVTPVNSNTVVDRAGWFDVVARTRIGSPHVIETMRALAADGGGPVAGYEANGGFLLQDSVERDGVTLAPLPTRDAALPIVALLVEAAARGVALSELRADLPPRFTASGRLQEVDRERVTQLLAGLPAAASGWLPAEVVGVDHTDGVRMTLASGAVVHLRASGNAPEMRVYVEADGEDAAGQLRDAVVGRVAEAVGGAV